MKHFIYAVLFALVPMIGISLASCNNDDDLPDVQIGLDVENATIVDGVIYVAQGDTLNVAGITIKNNEAGKGAAVTNVRYFNDGIYIGESLFAPFPAYGLTDAETPVGTYDLGIRCTVLAVDKSIAYAVLNYPYKVVASADEIPQAPSAQSASKTVSLER